MRGMMVDGWSGALSRSRGWRAFLHRGAAEFHVRRFFAGKERVMSRLWSVLTWRVGTEASDVRLQRWLCFAAAPAVLVLAGLALSKLTTTAGEALTGFLAASAVAVSFVILGIVAPLAQR